MVKRFERRVLMLKVREDTNLGSGNKVKNKKAK